MNFLEYKNHYFIILMQGDEYVITPVKGAADINKSNDDSTQNVSSLNNYNWKNKLGTVKLVMEELNDQIIPILQKPIQYDIEGLNTFNAIDEVKKV